MCHVTNIRVMLFNLRWQKQSPTKVFRKPSRTVSSILSKAKCHRVLRRRDILYELLLGEVLTAVVDIWLDCISPWFPSSRAHFTMFVSELRCLHQTKCFINRATNWKVVDCALAKNSLFIDNEQTSQSNSCVF